MNIWVDADSCPRRVREIVIRAAERTGARAVFVANRRIPTGRMKGYRMRVVADADREIVERVGDADLVVTRDIPLAAQLVKRGITVLNDRGTIYTNENVGERLSWRDFMAELRERGTYIPEQDRLDESDIREFANSLDRELRRRNPRGGNASGGNASGGNASGRE